MDEHRHPEEISEHIQSVSSRTVTETDRLVARIVRAYWPGGAADRLEPAAAEWVRRWRPIGPTVSAPACACAAGRCLVCN
jgi:hypothetical protein